MTRLLMVKLISANTKMFNLTFLMCRAFLRYMVMVSSYDFSGDLQTLAPILKTGS